MPYNNNLLGKALSNTNYSAMSNILEEGSIEDNYNCIIVLTHEGTLSIFNLQSLLDDYAQHVENILKTPKKQKESKMSQLDDDSQASNDSYSDSESSEGEDVVGLLEREDFDFEAQFDNALSDGQVDDSPNFHEMLDSE